MASHSSVVNRTRHHHQLWNSFFFCPGVQESSANNLPNHGRSSNANRDVLELTSEQDGDTPAPRDLRSICCPPWYVLFSSLCWHFCSSSRMWEGRHRWGLWPLFQMEVATWIRTCCLWCAFVWIYICSSCVTVFWMVPSGVNLVSPPSAFSAHVPLFQVSRPPFSQPSQMWPTFPMAHTNQSSHSVMIGSTPIPCANSQLLLIVDLSLFKFYFLYTFPVRDVKSTEDFTEPSIALPNFGFRTILLYSCCCFCLGFTALSRDAILGSKTWGTFLKPLISQPRPLPNGPNSILPSVEHVHTSGIIVGERHLLARLQWGRIV